MLPLDPPLRRTTGPDVAIDDTAWRRVSEWLPETADYQIDYAHSLLDLQPHNLFAMNILADHADSEFEHAAIVREAVRIGQRLWAPEISGSAAAPDWGGCPETKPFLTSVLSYAKILMVEGNRDEASQCLSFLLKLDPDDRIRAVESMEEAGLILRSAPGRRM